MALLAVSALLAVATPEAKGQEVGVEVKPVRAEKLPNAPGKTLTVVMVSFAPGGKSGAHDHAGSVFVYVLSGAVRSENSATGPVRVYKAGESFFEPPGSRHLVSENASATEPARVLAVFIADEARSWQRTTSKPQWQRSQMAASQMERGNTIGQEALTIAPTLATGGHDRRQDAQEHLMSPTILTQTDRIAILIPLAVGMIAVACTIIIHALALSATVHFVRNERRLGRAGASFWNDVAIVAAATSFAFAAHLAEIAFWAVLFMICGEFPEFGTAYNHSAVNYTTLGYGDVVMTPSWRLLGPLEAANGMLMFGVSTAMIFAVIQWLIRTRFVDLRD